MPVPVPEEVFEGLCAVRSLPDLKQDEDLLGALQYCERNGYHASSDWIQENLAEYVEGISRGFSVAPAA